MRRTAHQNGNRNTVVEDIRQIMSKNFVGSNMGAACLYWAKAACIRLRDAGHNAQLQAGTAAWRRVPEHLDDGIVDTHFGYEWNADSPEIEAALLAGRLPEMHVWAAIPERNQIIDMTTGFQVEQCSEMLGMDWPAEHPPDWLWIDCDKIGGTGFVYEPCVEAIRLSYGLLKLSEWGA